jgi:hypothetical protein
VLESGSVVLPSVLNGHAAHYRVRLASRNMFGVVRMGLFFLFSLIMSGKLDLAAGVG